MMQGALILSLAAFIAKILSAVYRVPFQNMVGNTGFYVYQQVYPIYGIGMTFALSGFPVFVSALVAQYRSDYELSPLLKRLFWILSGLGIGVFLLLYTQSEIIALWMGDSLLSPVIQSVSWMFLMMPFLVIARGYFQGTNRMVPTAVSQVMEQVVRVSVILLAASFYGSLTNDLYAVGTWAMSSAVIAAVMATLVLFYFKKSDSFEIWNGSRVIEPHKIQWGVLLKRLVIEGGTLCLLSSILVLFQLIDSFTLFKGLVEQGIHQEAAKDLKGIFDRGQPLVQLGMVVGVGFSSSYLPLLSRSYTKQHLEEFEQLKQSLLKMTMVFSVVATVGLLVVLPRVNHMLFGDIQGNDVLSVYIISIVLASMMMSYHGLLQSTGKYSITLIALFVGLIAKGVANLWFIPIFQTLGASFATILGLFVMLGMMWILSGEDKSSSNHQQSTIIKLGIVTIGMAIVVGILNSLFECYFPAGDSRTKDTLISLLLVSVGMIVFIIGAIQIKLFTIREWLMIPKGKSLLRFTRKWKRRGEKDEIR
ncbi:MAG: polysaccharide biosynthesis protein [Granulicatella sp.]|nr:polysaccharide biosynthesis protein [Granulicatella sp.]